MSYSTANIDTIMLFAAGRGSRMAHLTATGPKSLIFIAGQPILHHALDLCKTYQFKRIVINTHYFHDQIMNSIDTYRKNNLDFPEIVNVYEEELLETGGAIKNAISVLGDKPIFTLNTDVILKADYNVFHDMISSWDPVEMDFLLLMQPYDQAVGYTSKGDFDFDQDNRLIRPGLDEVKQNYSYMYTGLSILNPSKIVLNPLRVFSLKEYYFNNDKLFGIKTRNAKWYHATHPSDVLKIDEAYSKVT